MSMSDPVADMLTRVRNASRAELSSVEIPQSKLKTEIARILKKEGFVSDYVTEGHGGKKVLRVYLRYDQEREPIIQGLKRISRPSLRKYVSATDIPRVLGGIGLAILSTSSGLLTDAEARKARIGGEVLCYVW